MEVTAAKQKEESWIPKGRQQKAVVRTLYKPMIAGQILERARKWAPKIQLRDIWFILQEMNEKELVRCLTPQLATGKLWCFTERGRSDVAEKFELIVPELPKGMDWVRYAMVVRGEVRRNVLEEIGRPSRRHKKGKSASEIRKALVAQNTPACLTAVLRALKDLRKLELTRSLPCPNDKRSKLWVYTPEGRQVVTQLQL